MKLDQISTLSLGFRESKSLFLGLVTWNDGHSGYRKFIEGNRTTTTKITHLSKEFDDGILMVRGKNLVGRWIAPVVGLELAWDLSK
jgi:hypothetical protein